MKTLTDFRKLVETGVDPRLVGCPMSQRVEVQHQKYQPHCNRVLIANDL